MKYRTLDKNGDYTLGRNQFLKSREAVGQAIKTRMYLLYSEWWEDTEDGLPLFEKILGRYGSEESKNAVDLIISDRILGTTGVTEITGFESTLENRHYQAQCIVNTEFGEVSLSIMENAKSVEVSY